MRVKDFTYYPIMSTGNCAFRVENKTPRGTYHQCPRVAREKIEGWGFCFIHAEVVRTQATVKEAAQ